MLDIRGDQLLEALTEPVFLVDAAGAIHYANAAAERQMGRAVSELTGLPITCVVFDQHSGNQSDLQSKLASAGATIHDAWLDTALGNRLPVSLSVIPLPHGEGSAAATMLIVARDRSLAVELTQAVAAANQQIDEVKEQRLRSERLATLGRLAGGMGHELRNLAQLQVLALEALTHEVPALRTATNSAFTDLERTTQQVGVHAERLLKLTQPSPDHIRPVSLSEIIREVVATLGGAGKLRGITTDLSLLDNDLCVAVNRIRLEQVVFNLAINAVEAMASSGGTLRIAAGNTGSGRVVVEVTDTGSGISPAALPRIFEPFFTTKPRGTTGLGLAVAKEIVEGHGGHLLVASNSSAGATFRFDLPCPF